MKEFCFHRKIFVVTRNKWKKNLHSHEMGKNIYIYIYMNIIPSRKSPRIQLPLWQCPSISEVQLSSHYEDIIDIEMVIHTGTREREKILKKNKKKMLIQLGPSSENMQLVMCAPCPKWTILALWQGKTFLKKNWTKWAAVKVTSVEELHLQGRQLSQEGFWLHC